MTRTALPHLAPAPQAAVAAAAPPALAATGGAPATGGVTGLHHLHRLHRLHHLHPAAGPPLDRGPALTLAATDVPPAVAVIATTDITMAAAAGPHHAATEPTLAPTAARPHQTGTPIVDAIGPVPGPAPGLTAVGTGTGGP